MFWTNFKRIVRSGFMNFWRNGTVSLASVFMLTVMLLVMGLMLFGRAVLITSLDELRSKVDITVTFVPTAAETDILNIKSQLEKMPEVSLVTYTSRDDVLTAFESKHQNDQSILTALNELSDNPLGAELDVKAKDPSEYQGIADFLQSSDTLTSGGVNIIDHVNYAQNAEAINRLTAIIHMADNLGFGVGLAFAILSILIAFNTVRLTIYISKDEISVMRLVGASRAYIQGPFVVVGAMYGLVAGLLALMIFLPVTYWVGKVTTDFFIGLNLFSYYLTHIPEYFGILVGSGLVVGILASLWASRRYLSV
jgi:cell division transport system permease protein